MAASRCLALTTLNRLALLPALAERGMTRFEVKVWRSMYAQKGTPAPVLEKLTPRCCGMQDQWSKRRRT
jgi:tripartite-type tricarboxylate transporter receptor subunit TctC